MEKMPAQDQRPRPTLTMNELLGTDGIKLFKAAIAEENSSKAFREAVFLKSIQHFDGPAFGKKLVLWVAGPSASGKSTAANAAVKTMTEHMPQAFAAFKNKALSEVEKLKTTQDRKIPLEFIQDKLKSLESSLGVDALKLELRTLQENAKHLLRNDKHLLSQVQAQLNSMLEEATASLTQGNDVVSVDGDIARNVSQVRQYVLEVALAKNYKGISDLQSNTNLETKEYVKQAALLQEGLNVVLPETFAESMLLKRFGPEGAYKQNEMQAYQDRKDVVQAFCEVKAEQGQEARFQASVMHLGTARAFLSEEEQFTADDIEPNNRDLPCKSKEYGAAGFSAGVSASNTAKKNFKRMNPQGWVLEITNDIICLKATKNGMYTECGLKDTPDIKLANRDYQQWLKEQKQDPQNTKDLKEWYAEQKRTGNTAPLLIEDQPADLIKIQTLKGSIPYIYIAERDFKKWHELTSKDPKSTPSLLLWCLTEYQQGGLITPVEILLKEELTHRRRQSAPAILQTLAAEVGVTDIVMPRKYSNPTSNMQATQSNSPSTWRKTTVSKTGILKYAPPVKIENNQAGLPGQSATVNDPDKPTLTKEQEFAFAAKTLSEMLIDNPEHTSFKIVHKEHKGHTNHSFICLKGKDGQFEILRIAADILGKGTEGKVKLLENSQGEEYVVKVSQAPAKGNAIQLNKSQDELNMMDEMGLLLGHFVREKDKSFDKTMQREIGDKQYVVQRYIRGKELAKILATQQLSEVDKLTILREVLFQVKEQQKKGIIHRDLKPENMIIELDQNGHVKECTFIDYGVSIKTKVPGETITRGFGGSPRYMAPELGRTQFYAEYKKYQTTKTELTKMIDELNKRVANPERQIIGTKRLNVLKLQLAKLENDYLSVLRKEYTFNQAVDVYAVGVIAANDLGLNLSQLGINGLLEANADKRMEVNAAIDIVQQQINIEHNKAMKTKPKEANTPQGHSERISPLQIRRPAIINPQQLQEIDGKLLLATPKQIQKLNKLKMRGQTGIFEIDDRYFIIDDNKKSYAIYQSLASGSFGSVFLAQDLEVANWVAVKSSGDKLARGGNKPFVVQTLEQENAILQELGQLVGTLTAFRGVSGGNTQEHALAIQPYAFGDEYFDINKDNVILPAEQVILMSLRMFEELDNLHQKGILHLDIKPENMKWDSELNRCTILDMGTAKKTNDLHFESWELVGTQKYQPPEIHEGGIKHYSDKVDVYAGAKSIQPLLEKAVGLSENDKLTINAFMERALADDPAKRPSAAEAKVFFNHIALQLLEEQKITDTSLSIQVAEQNLKQYIEIKLNNNETVQAGIGKWMREASNSVTLPEKIEIAKQMINVLEKIQKASEFDTNQITQEHVLALAEAIIEARVNNIENPDQSLEVILKQPADQLRLKTMQTNVVKDKRHKGSSPSTV